MAKRSRTRQNQALPEQRFARSGQRNQNNGMSERRIVHINTNTHEWSRRWDTCAQDGKWCYARCGDGARGVCPVGEESSLFQYGGRVASQVAAQVLGILAEDAFGQSVAVAAAV